MNSLMKVAKIAPYISTANLGDFIIGDYCDKILEDIFGDYQSFIIPSREKISKAGAQAILSSDYTFVLGTNLLCSDVKKYKQWNINKLTRQFIIRSNLAKIDWLNREKLNDNARKLNIVLMGAGWFDYQQKPTLYTKDVFHSILDPSLLHSVRDSYTEQMLRNIGFKNVINTACPTMWRLKPDFCKQISCVKSDTVVTTLTDYRKNITRDKELMELLFDNYKEVYLWLQSSEDYQYIEELKMTNRINLIPPTLKAYDAFLKEHNTDYVGTRLHGGIRALNYRKRTCIIGIDNRAIEIGKDTNLPVISQENIIHELPGWINSPKPTEINLPLDNIIKWRSQFDISHG